jgi:serine/threonine protein kinase
MQPEKIGRYEIKSELGRGGMATVYHGYDPRFEREVAVKVLPPELLHADPQFRVRFEREAKIIAQLEHPSIVPVYDVGEENNQPYFVMRFMGGGSLTDRIKAGMFTVGQATKILEQIAPGLDEAHSKGIIHRDFKPSNILFDNKGAPYISDFGIAKMTQSAGTVTGSAIIGTPAYMAPEQAQGINVDGRADIYALGIILYEMLTGKQPYEADTPMGVAIKHITDPVPHILDANPNLPYEIEEIIQKAMAKDREERFSTAQEMVDALREVTREIESGRTTSKRTAVKKAPTKPGATVPQQKQPEKKSFNVWIVIIPLLIIGIGGGFFLLSGNNSLFGKEPPTATSTNTLVAVATSTIQPTVESTATEAAPTETFTPAPPTLSPTATIPAIPVVGGVDKIAFIKENDIWIMNVDGSDAHSLTLDRAAKFDLQWLPDGKTLLYVTGKTVKTINVETQVEEIITNFASAEYFEAFRVSPDGKQVAISLARELHIVPFDLEQMKNVKKKSDLLALKGCFYDVSTIRIAVLDVLWSKDMQRVAVKFLAPSGNAYSQTMRVMDIHLCNSSLPTRLDEFPAERFAFKTDIMSIDWNGDELFVFNSNERNGGFGNLYLYNTVTHQAVTKINVVGSCCYRDARFSPDGNFIIFAYQDINDADGVIQLYYIPSGSLTTPGNYKPLANLPEEFFIGGRKESPQPALRPVQK